MATLKNKAIKKNKKNYNFLISVAIVVASLLTGLPQKFYKKIQLINFYSRITNYEKTYNYEEMYKLFTPDYRRKISLNDYVAQRNDATKPYSLEFIAHSYNVEDNKGIIDRTIVICKTSGCSGSDRSEGRAYKEYIYINGNWYTSESNTVYCLRTEPYPMPPEFERAISLIIQRFSQKGSSIGFDKDIETIKNCLYISYSPDLQKNNTEGLFYFDKNSTKEKLNILVSDTYKVNDDILTALLLTHEIDHALQYVHNVDSSCFEKEAEAFYIQSMFFYVLNKAEQDSLTARATVGGSSEIDQLFDFFRSVIKLGTKDPYGSMLKVVKSNPYYQKQCLSN